MLINKVKIYTNLELEDKTQEEKQIQISSHIESLGNKHATICCFVNCPSPLSESKDYKTLTKVFEKLMMKIENVFVVNVNSCKSANFIHFIHEFHFKKIFIFGHDALISNIPVALDMFQPTKYELYQILLTKNLTELTTSKDENLKRICWDSMKDFYKM